MKTGTANKYDPETHQYSPSHYLGSFAGLAPIDHPRLAIVAMLAIVAAMSVIPEQRASLLFGLVSVVVLLSAYALRRALRGPLSVEAKRRVEALLEGPAPRPVPSRELLQRLRAIHVLEQIGSLEATRIVQALAEGAPSARETLEAKIASERLAHRIPR